MKPWGSELGSAATIKVNAPTNEWKTVLPPVPVAFPFVLTRSASLRDNAEVLEAAFFWSAGLVLLIVFVNVIINGVESLLSYKSIFFILFGLAAVRVCRAIYYTGLVKSARDSISDSNRLVVGTSGFIDTGMLGEPVAWDDVESIEAIGGRGYISGAKLKLKRPCTFREDLKSKLSAKVFGRCFDERNIFIDMTLTSDNKIFDQRLLIEIFKNRIKAVEDASIP